MKSTFNLPNGERLVVIASHPGRAVIVEKHGRLGDFVGASTGCGFYIPVEFAGVFAQAIECAAQKIETGPCAPLNPRAVSDAQQFGVGMDLTAEEPRS